MIIDETVLFDCIIDIFDLFLSRYAVYAFAPDDFLNSVGIYHTVCIRILSLIFASISVLMFVGVGKQVIAYKVE